MYSKLPNLVFGFHGCHKEIYEKVLAGEIPLNESHNAYDWLGHGVYFWENSVDRAWKWAEQFHGSDGRVLGAILDLGHCLNLTDSGSTNLLKSGYEYLKLQYDAKGELLPENTRPNKSGDKLLRNLDCAIIESLHQLNEMDKSENFDSVRGIFFEGDPIVPGSEFREQTHVQIAVCNPNCIKGYFAPRDFDPNYPNP